MKELVRDSKIFLEEYSQLLNDVTRVEQELSRLGYSRHSTTNIMIAGAGVAGILFGVACIVFPFLIPFAVPAVVIGGVIGGGITAVGVGSYAIIAAHRAEAKIHAFQQDLPKSFNFLSKVLQDLEKGVSGHAEKAAVCNELYQKGLLCLTDVDAMCSTFKSLERGVRKIHQQSRGLDIRGTWRAGAAITAGTAVGAAAGAALL